MTPEKIKAMEVLLDAVFEVTLSMNDTFAFSSGDAETMSTDDFEQLIPIIAKYGHDALVAYAAVKRKAEPISCRCNHKNEQYYAAKKEIEELKKTAEYFMDE